MGHNRWFKETVNGINTTRVSAETSDSPKPKQTRRDDRGPLGLNGHVGNFSGD